LTPKNQVLDAPRARISALAAPASPGKFAFAGKTKTVGEWAALVSVESRAAK
jgi:hypothetical protein